ncbi:MAG TPA: hypothetical protein VHR66_08795 [Gemmataceae bacterium]|jgi:hypothetical protein|nr:hypothetical protein [Gemmataceae bacterium]
MSTATVDTIAEGVIWDRVLRSPAIPLSAEAARYFLRMQFPKEDQDRMHKLAAKAREGSLSTIESVELRNYERVGNLLALMKSQARRRIKKVKTANGMGS